MNAIFKVTAISLLTSVTLISQNDIDAMRYSQTYFGGTSRSKAMAGSFGALGADGSCMAINPAGIGLYKKGDINLSVGLKFNNIEATHNGEVNKNFKIAANFDGLTLVGAWDSKLNTDNHHALGLSSSQTANFANNTTINGRANKSITQDMLATAYNINPANLDGGFAGMAYETYIIDTMNNLPGKYYSFVDAKYSLNQSKSIQTSGRINEWNFNYAYGYKDKLYVGASIGVPSVNYNYNSIYTETDDKDSMRIYEKNGQTYSTYNYDVKAYLSTNGKLVGGFKSLSYQETYKTTGSGVNLKIGAIYRAAPFLRVGAAFHSPTFYTLSDTYDYKMNSAFDNGETYSSKFPENGGKFNYSVITPMKLIGSIAYLHKKIAAINIDYEVINYNQASLQASKGELVFADVNKTIRTKYTKSANLKIGAELNLKPVFIRAGYAAYGSPFEQTFNGNFVKTFYTGGIGFRQDKWYFDVSVTKSLQNENYYMYNANYVDKSSLKNNGTTIAVTVGSKF